MRRRSYLAFLALLSVILLLAACQQQGNQAPTVQITSPADGTSVAEGNVVELSATATDPEEGDLSDGVTWESDLDGALTPDQDGNVKLSVGTHTITASASDSLGLTASDSVEVTVTAAVSTHLVSNGTSLSLVSIVGDEIEVVATAEIPAAGLLAGHRIFNVIKHPTLPLYYAASANDCSIGTEWCWGNGRIDTFEVDGDTITHVFAFVEDETQTEISCAVEVVDEDYVGQVGYCAPVGMVFSSDATRLYVDDDELDGVQIFAVDPDGVLTFIAEGASTSDHGLAIDPTDTYLYNGSHVIDVSGDVATDLTPGNNGNATALVDLDGTTGIITTYGVGTLAVLDLVDPTAPSEVDSLAIAGTNSTRYFDFLPSLERIVSVGMNVVNSVSFDGATLSLDDTYNSPGPDDVQYRTVSLSQDGSRALAAWFTTDTVEQPGGVDLFSVAADGSLAQLDSIEFPASSRVVLRLQ